MQSAFSLRQPFRPGFLLSRLRAALVLVRSHYPFAETGGGSDAGEAEKDRHQAVLAALRSW